MKLIGFRTKTGWKMTLSTIVYGLFGLIVLMMIIDPSAEETATTAQNEASETVLTDEMAVTIEGWAKDATMYDLYKLEGDREVLTVWIELNDEAIKDAEGYTTALTNRIAKEFGGIDISVTAMQSIEGSTDVLAFGSATYIGDSKKIEYKKY